MRLVLIGHSAGMLGAERSMLDIASGAASDGHEVFVVLPTSGPLEDRLRAAGATVVIHPMRAWMGTRHWVPPVGLVRILQAGRAVDGLVEILQSIEPDVVVTNTSVIPAGARAARRLGLPHIWIVRESLRDNGQLRSFMSKRWIARQILGHASSVCTISPYVEEQLFELARSTHPRSFTVSPNPASSTPPMYVAPPPASMRTLLLPGYFSREKGQHLVILGAFLARGVLDGLTIRVVGRGSTLFTVVLRVMIRGMRLGSTVLLLPWSDDLRTEYTEAHFVVSGSRNEAFGRTVVEAFGHGRPVIGFCRGATSMLLEGGGGITAEPSNARGMAAAIRRAATMSAGEYDRLRAKAEERGDEFAHAPSQYAAFRGALTETQRQSVATSG